LISHHLVAPTEVKFEFLKSSFFVAAVFLWLNRVVISINLHQEATRPKFKKVSWGWRQRRNKIFQSLIFYAKKYFYLSTLLNSNRKTSGVNIDFN
jgi:hypothetical protein